MTDDDLLAERAEMIRDLSKGEGLTVEHIEELMDKPTRNRLFMEEDAAILRDLLAFALGKLPYSSAGSALHAALVGGVAKGANLSQRRESYLEYLASARGDSAPGLRTLIRWEAEGAEQLARFLDVARTITPAQDPDVQMLSGRIADLEEFVLGLINDIAHQYGGTVGARWLPMDYVELLQRISHRGVAAARANHRTLPALADGIGPDPDLTVARSMLQQKRMTGEPNVFEDLVGDGSDEDPQLLSED